MEGLEGVEEQRRRGKKGRKLLLSEVKVLLLSVLDEGSVEPKVLAMSK